MPRALLQDCPPDTVSPLPPCHPQVKGHIAKMAMRLEDEDARIAALAQLFFHELAKKEYKVGWAAAPGCSRAGALLSWFAPLCCVPRCQGEVGAALAEGHRPGWPPATAAQSQRCKPRSSTGAYARGLPPVPASFLSQPSPWPLLEARSPALHATCHVQGTSPIYNLLPDILSNLSKERGLGKAQFQSIMQQVGGAEVRAVQAPRRQRWQPPRWWLQGAHC